MLIRTCTGLGVVYPADLASNVGVAVLDGVHVVRPHRRHVGVVPATEQGYD